VDSEAAPLSHEHVEGDTPDRGEQPLVLVLSDNPEFFAPLTDNSHEFFFWRGDDPAADTGRPLSFSGPLHDSATYAFAAGRSIVTVVDFKDETRIAKAVVTIHHAAPEAAFLVLYDDVEPKLDDEIPAHCVRWADMLHGELDGEIARVQTRKRVMQLREFAGQAKLLPILLHPDPDPDAIACALALRVLLERPAETCPVVTSAFMTRPENRRMAELLNVRITEISRQEMMRFERVVCLDCQPPMLDIEQVPHIAIIDHHPAEQGYNAEFKDIRVEYGAASTILTQYLRADDERRIGEQLATALLYGIKTDTLSLTRAVTPADVRAYAFLQARADIELLHKIEQPSNPKELVRTFGRALHTMAVADGIAAAYVGELPSDYGHILADLADEALSIDEVVWAAVGAYLDNAFVISLRHTGDEPGAGALAKRLAGPGGSGGGHATMSRVMIPAEEARRRMTEKMNLGGSAKVTPQDCGGEHEAEALLAWIREEVEQLLSSKSKAAA
jgi:nanoRNase/pAp phosphatase (c-di-AMP/oligoRNAs hydrolase)